MSSIKRYSTPIREWPEGDRPREKLLKHGPDALTDTELVAIMLRTGDGASGQSALDHARTLPTKFGSLIELEKAGTAEICEIPGIGPAKAATIKAALALGRRLAAGAPPELDTITGPEDVFRHFQGRLSSLKKETFWALLLDIHGKIIKSVRISEGSLTEALVHPREVFLPAIRESAARVIFVHNHPSGNPKPSEQDFELNLRLIEAGKLLGIPVLDHIVIGGNLFCCIDMKERPDAHALAAEDQDED